ncbi:MAG: phage portal protein [Pseudomonadota bacterium]
MGLIETLKQRVGFGARPRNENRITEAVDLETAIRELVGSGRASSGVVVTPTTASRLAAVGSCIRVLQDDIAALPLVLYRQEGDRREAAKDDPLYAVLKVRANEWQTAFEFKQYLQRSKLLRGNGYALIVRGFGGNIQELIPMHPDRVKPKQDDRTLAVTFEYTRPDGRRVVLEQSEVFHLRGPSDDGILGLSPIHHYRETIGDGLALREHGSRFFANGARPSGTLEVDGVMTPEAKKAMRSDFETLYSGVDKSGKVVVLDQGVKYNPMSLSMEDAQYLDSRKFNRAEICGIFGVPPHKIADLERATFSNIEHQSLEYVNSSLMPHLVAWEQAAQRDLMTDPDLYCRFNTNALLRGDFKSRQEGLAIQRRNGVINANEWRALEEMNNREDAGGAGYIIESNMQPDDGAFKGMARKSETNNA